MIISGGSLRLLRLLKGIKQKTVAQELGISQPAYSNLEKAGYVDFKKLEIIISILGYSKTELKDIMRHLPFGDETDN